MRLFPSHSKSLAASNQVTFLLSLLVCLAPIVSARGDSLWTNHNKDTAVSHRQERFLFFIKIRPDLCVSRKKASNSTRGTCLSYTDCKSAGGESSGSCAKGFGTCCIIEKTCGAASKMNNTHFVNPGFPNDISQRGKCKFIVNRKNKNVCQIRLDFEDFKLAQPNSEGFCETDVMTVTAGSTPVPPLCGDNSGQHMYIDVDPSGSAVHITVDTDITQDKVGRHWNIKVTHIECDSVMKAPSGCLQYFTSTSGRVSSFNYPPKVEEPQFTRQLANQEYTVCVRPEAGYCGISWRPNVDDDNSFYFFVNGNYGALNPDVFGNVAAMGNDQNCDADYVVIPGGKYRDYNGLQQFGSRYCGAGFADAVSTTFKPFNLYVKTDNREVTRDTLNAGFSLNFRQDSCNSYFNIIK